MSLRTDREVESGERRPEVIVDRTRRDHVPASSRPGARGAERPLCILFFATTTDDA